LEKKKIDRSSSTIGRRGKKCERGTVQGVGEKETGRMPLEKSRNGPTLKRKGGGDRLKKEK